MPAQLYSQRLGELSDEQFQAALTRFDLGTYVAAEPVPLGLFGQNVFLTSSQGQFVLRGDPHFSWQFPTEQFYARQLYERAQVPAPWPYLIDLSQDIFGWSYVIMPRLPGEQTAHLEAEQRLTTEDQRKIAATLGTNLARMQTCTWPFSGRYDPATQTVQPFELLYELAWPFPISQFEDLASQTPRPIAYDELVPARICRHLARARQSHPTATTDADLLWVEALLERAAEALRVPFQPCFVLQDYKPDNLLVTHEHGQWRVSGVFDLMQAYFGDGEADLSRTAAIYLDQALELAHTFIRAYMHAKTPRPGFAERFASYMLDDRAILWEYFQRTEQPWLKAEWTFRDWAERYIHLGNL